MRPPNLETYQHLAVWKWWHETMEPRNYKTKKPVNIFLSRDGVHETMKPQNNETYWNLVVKRWSA